MIEARNQVVTYGGGRGWKEEGRKIKIKPNKMERLRRDIEKVVGSLISLGASAVIIVITTAVWALPTGA